jgi:PAS domain S-box-containing protein
MTKLLDHAEGIFRLIVEGAPEFAIFLLDRDGRIESWNLGACKIFGHETAEAVGQSFEMLFTEEDLAHGRPRVELATALANGRAEDTRRHRRKDGRAVFIDGVTTAVRGADGEIAGFAKIGRDITERYRTEQRLAAQLALTTLLDEQRTLGETARRIMQTVCENLGWDIGGLWLSEADGSLRCIDVWHAGDLEGEAIAAFCGTPLLRGVGLPGGVAEKGRPLWVESLATEPELPRAPLAAAAGMRSAFAFPLTHEGRVIGVLELFGRSQREPDLALLPAMSLIGAQIGDYIERRRTADALRESEARYRLVSETAQDAIFTVDEQSSILFCNPAVERIFGYKPEELVGRSLDAVIPERYRAEHRAGMRRYLDTREQNIPWQGFELPGLHRDGREIPLEISFAEWTHDQRTVFTGIARDITDRKRALEEERKARAEAEAARAQIERRAEEEASFRHLASALTGAVEMTEVLYEITNRATLVTRADGVYVERIVGPDRTVEVVSAAGRGTPARGLQVQYPGSLTEEIMKHRQPVILADMQQFGRAMAPYLMDTCPNCQVLVTPLIAEEEPLGALVLLNSSASGRRFGDPEIVRARTLGDLTSLALRRVRLMEQEREAKEKAEAAVRVRDETLGIVSHDLRNPLTKVALSADLLVDASAADQVDLIATIRDAARQMERLIEDLLDVARLEAGRFSVIKEMIEPAGIVREACDSHESLAARKELKIVCTVDEPLGRICADRGRLLQVFGNLIGNALKFTPPRGTITIEARAERGEVIFRVSDSGPGIPEADLSQVFRPYWQAKKTAHMGAGLGLAIVRGIVEAHGGRVWAQNMPGDGARFTFTIPAAT